MCLYCVRARPIYIWYPMYCSMNPAAASSSEGLAIRILLASDLDKPSQDTTLKQRWLKDTRVWKTFHVKHPKTIFFNQPGYLDVICFSGSQLYECSVWIGSHETPRSGLLEGTEPSHHYPILGGEGAKGFFHLGRGLLVYAKRQMSEIMNGFFSKSCIREVVRKPWPYGWIHAHMSWLCCPICGACHQPAPPCDKGGAAFLAGKALPNEKGVLQAWKKLCTGGMLACLS